MDGSSFKGSDLLQIFTSAVANAAAGKPSVEVDLHEFLHHLDGMDASEEEKLEYLGLIASIMQEFVDIGFGIHPVQQACGQVSDDFGDAAQAESEVLDSEHSERTHE